MLVGEVACLSVVTQRRVAVAKAPVGSSLTDPVQGGIKMVSHVTIM